MHLILLSRPPRQKMHTPSRIPLHLERTRRERPLLPNEDIEIIIGGVQPRVPLRTEWRSKDNEVLGNAGMDDIHGTHGAAGIVEHPLVLVSVETYVGGRVRGREVCDDVVDHARWVVG